MRINTAMRITWYRPAVAAVMASVVIATIFTYLTDRPRPPSVVTVVKVQDRLPPLWYDPAVPVTAIPYSPPAPAPAVQSEPDATVGLRGSDQDDATARELDRMEAKAAAKAKSKKTKRRYVAAKKKAAPCQQLLLGCM